MAKAILRQHTRASSSTKVSSLYLFDAIARHAKDIVKKNGVGFDANDARAPAGSDAIDGTVEALISGASNFLAAASEVASELALDTVKGVSREQQVSIGTHPSFFSTSSPCRRPSCTGGRQVFMDHVDTHYRMAGAAIEKTNIHTMLARLGRD